MKLTKNHKAALAFLLCVIVFFGGVLLARGVMTSFGTVEVQQVYYTDGTDGGQLYAKLFIPDSATVDNPVPGFIFYPGNDSDTEKYNPIAVELSRRGYGVMVAEIKNQGVSVTTDADAARATSTPDEDWWSSWGGNEALGYLRSMEFVDSDHIVVGGHSLGGFAAIRTAVNEPEYVDGCIMVGVGMADYGVPTTASGAIFGGPGAADHPPLFDDIVAAGINIMAVVARDDSDSKSYDSFAGFCGLEDTDDYVSGKVYGSFEDGTARYVYEAMNAVHVMEQLNPGVISAMVDFVQNSVPIDSGFDSTDLVYGWLILGTTLVFISLICMVFPLGYLALQIPFFASICVPAPAYRGARGKSWWILAVLTAVMGPALFFPLTQMTSASWFPQAAMMSILPMKRANALLVWALGLAVVVLISNIVVRFIQKKEKRLSLVEYGLAYESKTGANSLKTILLAVLLFAAVYSILEVQFRWTSVDAKIWISTYKVMTARQLSRFMRYVLPYIVIYIIFFANIWANVRPAGGKLSVFKEMLINIVLLSPWYLLWAIRLGPFAMLKESGTIPTWTSLMYGSFWGVPVSMCIAAAITTFFNRKTGRVYLGAVLSALFAVWNLVVTFS